VPANVGADGNCLYRSGSLAVYGTEIEYAHVRLLAAIESLLFSGLYDSTSADYYDQFKADNCLVLPDYKSFVNEIVNDGTYSDMPSVLCLSSVVQKPLQTRWPIVVQPRQASPMTKLVFRRDVQTANAINVLWTTARYTGKGQIVNINHFMPLIVSPVECPPSVGLHAVSDVIETDTEDDSKQECEPETTRGLTVVAGKKSSGNFLSTSVLLNILLDQSFIPLFEYIPTGLKEDCGIKVKHVDAGHKF